MTSTHFFSYIHIHKIHIRIYVYIYAYIEKLWCKYLPIHMMHTRGRHQMYVSYLDQTQRVFLMGALYVHHRDLPSFSSRGGDLQRRRTWATRGTEDGRKLDMARTPAALLQKRSKRRSSQQPDLPYSVSSRPLWNNVKKNGFFDGCNTNKVPPQKQYRSDLRKSILK